MELTPEAIEQLKADLSKAKTYEDLMGPDGAIKKLMKNALEGMLDAELTEHLGYQNTHPQGKTPATAGTANPENA